MTKIKIDAQEMKKLIEKHHGNKAAIARDFGVSWDTVDRMIRSRKDLLRALDVATQVRVDLAEEGLDRKVEEGNLKAIIYTLSTLGKDRGYTTRQELDAAMNHTYEVTWGDAPPLLEGPVPSKGENGSRKTPNNPGLEG